MSSVARAKWLAKRYWKGLRSGELRRGAAFKLVSRYAPSVTVDRGDGTYIVPTGDLEGLRTFMLGHYDLDVMRDAMTLVSTYLGREPLRDRILVEVGANIGTTTIPALREFGARRVLAIEPEPTNQRLLLANLAMNDLLDQVTLVRAAVSDQDTTLELELSPDSVGDHRIRVATDSPAEMNEAVRTVTTVDARRLDGIVVDAAVDAADIGLVWIDVQGHEAQVLAGAHALIEKGVPFVIEYSPYLLRRSGGLERIHDELRARFGRVVDIRGEQRDRPLTPAELDRLPERYPTFSEYTDLLLLP